MGSPRYPPRWCGQAVGPQRLSASGDHIAHVQVEDAPRAHGRRGPAARRRHRGLRRAGASHAAAPIALGFSIVLPVIGKSKPLTWWPVLAARALAAGSHPAAGVAGPSRAHTPFLGFHRRSRYPVRALRLSKRAALERHALKLKHSHPPLRRPRSLRGHISAAQLTAVRRLIRPSSRRHSHRCRSHPAA